MIRFVTTLAYRYYYCLSLPLNKVFKYQSTFGLTITFPDKSFINGAG